MTLSIKFKDAVDVAAGMVTVAGIFFAVWQYYATKHDGRVNASLAYVA